MKNWQSRTELLIGEGNLLKLKKSHVLVAGLGGVGSWAAELLVRGGVGKLTIADHDRITATNRNRQLPALSSTEGLLKADVMAIRLKDINPDLNLTVVKTFLKDDAIPSLLDQAPFDYVIDAIDTLSPKVFFLYNCCTRKYRVVSSMGSGNKFNPGLIQVADISETYNCRLAHYVRKHLHKLGIREGIKAVFSPEVLPDKVLDWVSNEPNKRTVAGTVSYMPALFGAWCASVVIRDLIGIDEHRVGI